VPLNHTGWAAQAIHPLSEGPHNGAISPHWVTHTINGRPLGMQWGHMSLSQYCPLLVKRVVSRNAKNPGVRQNEWWWVHWYTIATYIHIITHTHNGEESCHYCLHTHCLHISHYWYRNVGGGGIISPGGCLCRKREVWCAGGVQVVQQVCT